MKCNHCELCRKSGACTPQHHVCLDRNALRDIKPVKWKPGMRE